MGIRTVHFDPDGGFFLNQESLKIKGVCLHQDGGCLGSAMKEEIWERRLSKLKECGCNAIRCSHNPHMVELYQLCDQLGFLVMDEAFDEWENPKNKWSTGHNVYPPKHQGYFEEFPVWAEADLKSMVRRDRNHPSVIIWSIGNEIDYPNDPYGHPSFQKMVGNNDENKPELERRYDKNRPNALRIKVVANKLANIVREEDSLRPVTLASAYPELSLRLGLLEEMDILSYNYKEHLYEKDHIEFPKKPFLGSENGHGYKEWEVVVKHPFVSGQFLWTGIDYLGEAVGWPIHGSRSGLMTTAGFLKPEYEKRRSLWSEEMVFALFACPSSKKDQEWLYLSQSWNYREKETMYVICYTNVFRLSKAIRIEFMQNREKICTIKKQEEEVEITFETKYDKAPLVGTYYDADEQILGRASLVANSSCEMT